MREEGRSPAYIMDDIHTDLSRMVEDIREAMTGLEREVDFGLWMRLLNFREVIAELSDQARVMVDQIGER